MFILTWNPERYTEADFERDFRDASTADPRSRTWSTGARRTGIAPGDRAVLVRVRRDRGMVGFGSFASEIFESSRWDGRPGTGHFARVEWDTVLEPADRLPVEELKARVPGIAWDHLQASGVIVPETSAEMIEHLWDEHRGGPPY